MALWHLPWWEGHDHSWQVRLMLEALRGYEWVLTGTGTDSVLGFTYPVVDTNAQNIMNKP